MYARTQEDIGPGLTAREERGAGNEISNWYFEGVIGIGFVPDVESAFLFAAGLDLLDVVLIQCHGGPILNP